MRQAVDILEIATRGKGLIEITREVRGWVAEQGVATGLLTLFCRHTSASLLIQENADPDVRHDLEVFFETIAPEDPGRYVHEDEGPDDMPAHLRTALTQVQLSIPVSDGAPMLGTWQGIYLFEHRSSPHRRQVALHVVGR
jgi:secondary thiamine-phosphate synthase enzyme